TQLLRAGVDIRDSRVVVDGFGIDGLDNRDVVDDRSDVRQQFADVGAVVAVLLEVEHRGDAGKGFLPAGHTGQPLPVANRLGQFGPVNLPQCGLEVEHVDARLPAGKEQVNDALGLGGEVRQPG